MLSWWLSWELAAIFVVAMVCPATNPLWLLPWPTLRVYHCVCYFWCVFQLTYFIIFSSDYMCGSSFFLLLYIQHCTHIFFVDIYASDSTFVLYAFNMLSIFLIFLHLVQTSQFLTSLFQGDGIAFYEY